MIILALEESIVSITGVKKHFAVHGDIFILIHVHVFVIDQAMMLEEIVIPTSVATKYKSA
jgi:hypothetical protein